MIFLIFCASLNFYTNSVTVKRADSSFIPDIGVELLSGDSLLVEDSSRAEILYPDSSKLYVDENSKVGLEEEKKGVFLELGRIWVKLKKLVRGESFEVNSPVSVSGVRGTEFTVSFQDEVSETRVISGEVNVRNIESGEEDVITREELARIKRGMRLEIRKFKLEQLKEWYRWKRNHLDLVIRRIRRALSRGQVRLASILIRQGWGLARRLNLESEYRQQIDELESEYRRLRDKHGRIQRKLKEIESTQTENKIFIQGVEVPLGEISNGVEILKEKEREVIEYIKSDRKLMARQAFLSLKYHLNRVENQIDRLPVKKIREAVSQVESDYKFLEGLSTEKGLNEEIVQKADFLLDRYKDAGKSAVKIRRIMRKKLSDFRSIKRRVKLLERKLQ